MRTTTLDGRRQQLFLERLQPHLEADERIRAAWLQGSVATGVADPWSDLDLYVAVADESYDEFVRGMRNWLAAVELPHGRLAAAFGPARMLGVTLDSGVRLDFFVEAVGRIAESARPAPPTLLLDRDNLAGQLRVSTAEPDNRMLVERLLDNYFFGFTWPARLVGREEWGSLLTNGVLVIYQFIVPAMLAQTRPAEAWRPVLHNERFLTAAQRAEVDELLAALTGAYGESPVPDADRLGDAHVRLVKATLGALHEAADAVGLTWPAESERAVRTFYRDEFGWSLDG